MKSFYEDYILPLLVFVCTYIPFWVVARHYKQWHLLFILLMIAFYIFHKRSNAEGEIFCMIAWIWGLVIVITSKPLWFTIVYAVMFVIALSRFISGLIGKKDEET